MRIILGHNHYRSSAPSGEDTVFENECRLLREHGVEVVPFEYFNDDIDDSTIIKKFRLARDSGWSGSSYRALSEMIRKVQPDLFHFHNTFPLISPSAYAACHDNNVPVVQTLHNYRFICPGALLMRRDRPCEDCVGHVPLPALRHRCYRNSLSATGAIIWIIMNGRLRGAYTGMVNRYIALTRFAKSRMVSGGLPRDRVEIKPNFLPSPPPKGNGDGKYAVYVGRLSEEKGLHILANAWRSFPDLQIKIFGDGPLRKMLEEKAQRERLSMEFHGYRGREEILSSVRSAMFQIIPSIWYEGFPMVVLEAYACGTPVIASRIGSLAEVVIDGKTGVHFTPGDSVDLANKVNTLTNDTARLTEMRDNARSLFEAEYTAENNFSILMTIYEKTIEDIRSDRK